MTWQTLADYTRPTPAVLDTLYDATRYIGKTGLPAEVFVGAVVIDAHRLRGYGAVLNGVTDDSAAVQSAINDAPNQCAAVLSHPSLVIDIPAGVSLALANGISSGACNVMLRGAGPNVSELRWIGGAGVMWTHGTAAAPSNGYFHAEGLSFDDSNPAGSGAIGLSVYLGANVAQKCFSLDGSAFRKWTTPVRLTNLVRGYSVTNTTIFGPDFQIQSGAGFDIGADATCTQGSFDGRFFNVMVANYAWGWRYNIQQPLEGQVFIGCNAYNGWGLCQVACNVGNGYKSLLWSFVDCDWQGLGFALDMVNCRNVRVSGGYWIANTNPAGLAPVTGAPRRRYFSFRGCENIRLGALEVDVLPGQEPTLSLIHFDANCFDARLEEVLFRNYATVYAGIEIEPNQANRIVERNTTWQVWGGGPKVFDPSGNQACETAGLNAVWSGNQVGVVTATAANTPTSAGGWEIAGVTPTLSVDSNGQVYVPFPARPVGGGTFFQGGPPVVTVSANNSLASVPPAAISSISAAGFVAQFDPSKAGLLVILSYRAKGI